MDFFVLDLIFSQWWFRTAEQFCDVYYRRTLKQEMEKVHFLPTYFQAEMERQNIL